MAMMSQLKKIPFICGKLFKDSQGINWYTIIRVRVKLKQFADLFRTTSIVGAYKGQIFFTIICMSNEIRVTQIFAMRK